MVGTGFVLALPFFVYSTHQCEFSPSNDIILNCSYLKIVILFCRFLLAKIFSLIDSLLGLTVFKYLFNIPILSIYLHF